jgi:hypothetical protein
MIRIGPFRFRTVVLALALAVVAIGAVPVIAADVTTPFVGKAVNGGTVTHETRAGRHVLTVSSDFVVPGSPDPHWQVVNSRGQVFLLDRLKLKDDKINTSITLPGYVGDVAKVQMWCSWAEVVLGEASFNSPIALHK